MSGILSGLEKLGLKGFGNLDVFSDMTEEKEDNNKENNEAKETVTKQPHEYEEELIFDKKFSCPCCYNDFVSKRVRTGKPRSLKPDSDLRPRYKYIDTVKYDVITCPGCGYSAMASNFEGLSSYQIKIIREKVSGGFSGLGNTGSIYSYDDAIVRFQLALLCSIVKKGKSSERAFLCLKLAWLYRGKVEELQNGFWDAEQEDIDELNKKELENLALAYEGFTKAYSSEVLPICGMNSAAYQYLLAELARRLGRFDESRMILSRVLMEKNINKNVRELVLELKEKLLNS